MKIYHAETPADYDALMIKLEEQGCEWVSGRKPTEPKDLFDNRKDVYIKLKSQVISRVDLELVNTFYQDTPIIKYKAKVDEKMRFTKKNVLEVFKHWRDTSNGATDGFYSAINNLDDTPEKVVVPKFVADFYEECENAALEFLITQLEATYRRSELGEWYRSCRGRHRNGRANAQEVIAKMKLYGYTIEPEKLYCIPLPHLETADGTKQYLTKSGAGNYFALSPCVGQKQRYTKEELERVPEVYKPYAKPIEEEEE